MEIRGGCMLCKWIEATLSLVLVIEGQIPYITFVFNYVSSCRHYLHITYVYHNYNQNLHTHKWLTHLHDVILGKQPNLIPFPKAQE